MKRGFPALILCAALMLVAGCGSNSSTSTISSARPTTSANSGGGLKRTTTPNFATPAGSASVQGGVVAISYHNITIAPDALRVKVGSTIRWTNYDSIEHNVTSLGGPQKLASKNFGEGASFQITATKPGVIHYECTIHPASMNGTIEVVK
jgi:plastocyanin